MIYHQGTNPLNLLDIQKDNFRVTEMKKWKAAKIALVVQLSYHIFKIILPFTTLAECLDWKSDECKRHI